jgi:hypothetical protein
VLKEDIEELFFKFIKFNFFRAACKSFIEMRSYLVTVITVTFRTYTNMTSIKHARPFGGQLSLSAQKERKRMMDRHRGKQLAD